MSDALDHIAYELLSRAFPTEDATRIFTEKVKQKPLYLRPSDTEVADARELRRRERLRKQTLRRKKQKPKPLSAKEKRALCIYDIPKESQKYHIYEPLHRMWVTYVQEVLGDGCEPVTAQAAAKLVSADFHGAEVEVVKARCVSRVGVRGIVVKDTKFTFEIVTRGDEVKTLPKEHSTFRFEIPSPVQASKASDDTNTSRNLVFELHGSQFKNRATDRANKKFKQKNLSDL
ncbi:MAG: hypothetical protein M1827_002384 [Pycnora praestabilis]|nr:MAG: hypothetical protein M1827_002384 [Pycnora praestabilis]